MSMGGFEQLTEKGYELVNFSRRFCPVTGYFISLIQVYNTNSKKVVSESLQFSKSCLLSLLPHPHSYPPSGSNERRRHSGFLAAAMVASGCGGDDNGCFGWWRCVELQVMVTTESMAVATYRSGGSGVKELGYGGSGANELGDGGCGGR